MKKPLNHGVRRVFALSLLGGLIAAAAIASPAQADEINSPVTVITGTTLTITTETSLNAAMVVEPGALLVVAAGATLTIEPGGTITIEGPAVPIRHEFEINGTVENKGNLIVEGHLRNNGELYNQAWFSVLKDGAYSNLGLGLFDNETAGTTMMAGSWDDLGRFFDSGTWQIPPDGQEGTLLRDHLTGAIYHVKSRLAIEPPEAAAAGCTVTAINASESLPDRYLSYAGHGQTLALKAMDCPGWVFDHWENNDLTGRPEVIQPVDAPDANWIHAVHSMVSPTAWAYFVPAEVPTTEPNGDPTTGAPPPSTDPTLDPGSITAASPSGPTLPATGTSASTWPNTMLALALIGGGIIISSGARSLARARIVSH